jgi:hypothetical protein
MNNREGFPEEVTFEVGPVDKQQPVKGRESSLLNGC